jgi:transcriptional regulator with XRE-family HTH domain
VKRYSYGERDYAFGQLMLTLRTTIGLTQANLGELLGVSRRAVAEWEAGSSYPKVEHLKQLIELGVQVQAWSSGSEEEEVRALWRAAHQKVLLGIGGVGKSALASYLGSRLAPHFEAVLWRSVRDAPACSELVADCITFLSETPPAAFPTSLEQRINQLLSRLQAHRCLLVLDNLETLLQSRDSGGGYLPGYEGYGRLIGRLAESAHQSCVLLTSREKPREIEPPEGVRSPVRSLRLSGMDEQAARVLLADKELVGTTNAWQRFVASYAGNPLALKIVAQAVSDLFSGELERFLQEGEPIFNGIRPVLRQQVGRLTPLEHLLLTWLAVLREWTPLETLARVLHPRVLRAQLLEALEALRRRSLVERGQQASFGLQSVVMEYLTDELGERLAEEIVRGEPELLRRVTIEQAQAKDYVRQTQVRVWREEGMVAHLAMRGHSDRVLVIAFSPDGETMASGAIIWTVRDEHVPVTSLAMSPNGKLVSGSYDGTIHVWDVRTGTHLARLHTQGRPVHAVACSADGRLLASGGQDAVIKLWDMQSHRHLASLLAERPYERLDISHTRGLTNAQQAALRALGAVDAEHGTPP